MTDHEKPYTEVTLDDEPFDRLTELCSKMTDALEGELTSEESEYIEGQAAPVRGIIYLTTSDRSGISTFGYPDAHTAMAEQLIHLQAIFEALGMAFSWSTAPITEYQR